MYSDYADELDQELDDAVPEETPETDEAEVEEEDAIVVEDDDDDHLDYRSGTKPKDARTVAKESGEEAQGEEEPKSSKKKIGNPFAALRVAEKNNRILNDRLSRLILALEQQKVAQPEEEVPEDEPDFGSDPLGATHAKVEKLLNETKESKEREKKRQEAAQQEEIMRAADQAMMSFKQKVGEDKYQAAILHLVRLRKADIEETMPDLTAEEVDQLVYREAAQEKFHLASRGMNPGETFYKYAVRHGFNPDAFDAAKKAKTAPTQEKKAAAPDPRKVIERAKDRDAKSKTIAAAKGKGTSALVSGDFIGMSDDEFDDYVDRLSKEKNGRRGGSLTVREILETR